MKLSELLQETGGSLLTGKDAEFSGLSVDSRSTGEGDLFFCFRGTHNDSHEYALDAEARGAAAVVCERDTGVLIPQLVVENGRLAMAQIASAFYGHPEKK